MSQMPRAPERLRKTEQHTEVNGKDFVAGSRTKERRVDEIVRNRVGIPPLTERDQPNRRSHQKKNAMNQGQRDQHGVPPRVTPPSGHERSANSPAQVFLHNPSRLS